MDMDVDHIWDLPIDNPPPTTADPAPSNTPNPPLFLPSDDEEDVAATTHPSANKDPDIDALFDGIDDLNEFAPALDLDALRREADARNTRLNDDGKKKRKPIPRLDEARLLGKNGLPQLIKDTKNFKPKGKGHEAADLDRVLQVYQFWSHRLYPKTRFKETVDRVEKLCHSKRMQVACSVWRDEAKGLINGVRLPPQRDNDDNSDTDSDANVPPPGAATAAVATSSSQPSSPARSRSRQRRRSATSDDSERESDGPSHLSDASRPPPSSPDRDEAATELDALLEEEALHAAQTSHAWKKPQASGDDVAMDADDDLWAALDTAAAPAAAPTTTQAPPSAADGDEEMWDVVAELEQEQEREATRQSKPVQDPPTAVDTQADDMDDLYL
ncbi:replication fork protection component Swi3-domain-containing protein [Lactarius quietus]|nr:replication fork protection component Swi3-domain-containing protein [Lactarius quietus]